MAGIVTDKRKLPVKWGTTLVTDRFGVTRVDQFVDQIPVPTQTTTGYRSGFRHGGNDITDPRALAKEQSEKFGHPFDTGHEFRTEKQQLFTTHPRVYAEGSAQYPLNRYSGPLWTLAHTTSAKQRFISPPEIDLIPYGTKAIGSLAPNKSIAPLAADAAEIFREGFPQFVGGKTIPLLFRGGDNIPRGVKTAGGEFLNWNFGVLPTVGALVKMVNVVLNAYPVLQQYIRDSERVVRRSKGFAPIIETSEELVGGTGRFVGNLPPSGDGGWLADYAQNVGLWKNYSSLRRELWFSGAFTYFISKTGKDPLSELDRFHSLARKLVDVDITADVIYTITPWSWLADWWFNFGDVLSNAVAFQQDGLVLHYGYMMCKSTMDNTAVVQNAILGNKNFGHVSTTYRVVRKERVRATPFGFGIQPGTFSAQQWAILVALGMTKGPNKLR